MEKETGSTRILPAQVSAQKESIARQSLSSSDAERVPVEEATVEVVRQLWKVIAHRATVEWGM